MADYRVLYYPDFSPDPTWLRRVLMLADRVMRIVPSDVSPDDPDDLLRLQDAIPECLSSVAPDNSDVAVESGDERRLTLALQLLGKTHRKKARNVKITITDGGLSVAGHVFLHDSKLSDFVVHQLTDNGLLMDHLRELTPSGRFLLVQEDASNVILAGVASRMARRLGVDAITDRPLPFAVGALRGVPQQTLDDGAAEGALLAAVAKLMIPASVAKIPPEKYREIRDSYAEIRKAFEGLTAELATQHRLRRGESADEFAQRVDNAASDFAREYRAYRKSRYARRIKRWGPWCIGGILAVPTAFVSPPIAALLTAGSFAFQIIDKRLSGSGSTPEPPVFHMLAGLRRDIIKNSGVRELV